MTEYEAIRHSRLPDRQVKDVSEEEKPIEQAVGELARELAAFPFRNWRCEQVNPLSKLVDRVYGLLGYATIEVPFTPKERAQLEERAQRTGFTPQQYFQAILAKHLLDHEEEVAEVLAEHKPLGSEVSA